MKPRPPRGRRKGRPVELSKALDWLRKERQKIESAKASILLLARLRKSYEGSEMGVTLGYDPKWNERPYFRIVVDDKSEIAPVLRDLRLNGRSRVNDKPFVDKASRTLSYDYGGLTLIARLSGPSPDGDTCSYETVGMELQDVSGLVCRHPDGTVKSIDGLTAEEWEAKTGHALT